MSENIVKLTLIVSNARGHLLLHGFGRQYLHAHVGDTTGVERQMLDEDVVGNKRIFTKLNFNCYAVLNVIYLIVRIYRSFAKVTP